MTRTLGRTLVGVFAIIGVATCATAFWFASAGMGARRPPGRIETAVARRLRSAAIPASSAHQLSPVPPSADALKDGMEHFADHCAVCHANNGSGETLMGARLYPRPPDLRQSPTQQLTDGELFYIIENGVRLTGMPAFGEGTAESAGETWRLVLFIRRLSSLTEAELQQMETLNPKTVDEWRDLEAKRKVLDGKGQQSPPQPAPKPHRHSHKH
jgi:mono/diheme cytochrome c family protein